ncbi:hypothetical protein [Cetobacterium somerae]|uniref:hypothetical protein n=1 Tax=Cetobacterium somerae TaxID=188913 RepID=UPI0038918B55
MKKVLLGLLALSAVSMAAPITNEIMNGDGKNNSSVFTPEQTGVVKLKGSMVSEIPVLKYVVYAGAADTTGTLEDTLKLPEFVLSQTAAENIFDAAGAMSDIYVKKITANGATEADAPTIVDLGATEIVSFKVVLDNAFTAIPGIAAEIKEGGSIELQPTNFYTKGELEAIVPAAKGVKVNEMGLFESTTTAGVTYQTPNSIYGKSEVNGKFSFVAQPKTDVWGTADTAGLVANVEKAFSTARAFSNVKVEAVVGF